MKVKNRLHKVISVKSIYIFLLILYTNPSYTQNLSDLNIADKLVGDWIDEASDELFKLKNSAIRDLDLLTEQRVEQIGVLFENLRIKLANDLDKQLSEVAQNLRENIYSIQDMLNKGYSEIRRATREFDLILNTNLTEICENLANFICPNNKIEYSFRYIAGINLRYSPSNPSYFVEIAGSAIKPGAMVQLNINGYILTPTNSSNEASFNKATIEIPSSIISSEFMDTIYNRVEIHIISVSEREVRTGVLRRRSVVKDTVALHTNLFLLPKYPFTYKILEHVDDQQYDRSAPLSMEAEFDTKVGSLDDEYTFELNENQEFHRIRRYWVEGMEDGHFVHPTKEHTYLFICNQDNPTKRERDKKITLTCRDVIANTLVPIGNVRGSIQPRNSDKIRLLGNAQYVNTRSFIPYLIEQDRNSLFSNPPPVPMGSNIRRPVHAVLEYFEKVPTTYDKNLVVTESSISKRFQRSGYLTYGSHFTESLVSEDSGYTVYLYPTFYSSRDEFIVLSSSKTSQSIDKIVKAELFEDDAGSSIRLRLELDKFF